MCLEFGSNGETFVVKRMRKEIYPVKWKSDSCNLYRLEKFPEFVHTINAHAHGSEGIGKEISALYPYIEAI